MLIVGQPKSASTSLLKTVAAIGRIRFQNGISRNASYPRNCPGWPTIQKYHGTMVERDQGFFNYWMSKRDCVYKEHILPTEAHLEMVRKACAPFVVLLRNPEHSFDNYVRLRQAYIDGKISKRSNSILHAEKFVNFDMEGLRHDLISFYQCWKKARLPNALTIDFDDLILDYEETIANVCGWLGIKGKTIPLVKAMGNRDLYCTYTGVGERRLRGGD